MFSLILSQALLMSELSSDLSKATSLFEICTCFLSVTSTSSNFFRSNLSKSSFCLAHLLTANLPFNFAATRQWLVSQSALLKDRTSNIFECRLLSIKT
jgi:hypothetical protein